ncbi:4-hydroxy-tetrahydrodipicolinate reductase [Hyalangium rubrum]|uniref:4-hydroxy-tetrahydrodipicolinate reductase n=1 Tax=Hyalangium rubrum TaxID=3103134 RepID=A0ABU5HER9_9BACT|nr:4-hydroxy-tetrahydrodipicolinate reductase [Hyalangium sp. s54d21]MDY7231948.1 4-hydroxy-tetrahydrodipicolinate reductase [Hyalangium sp. s54d21]
MLRTVITGVTGRMGGTLLRLARATSGFSVVGATVRPGSPSVGQDAAVAARQGEPMGLVVVDELDRALEADAQVVIDFTGAEASVHHARLCAMRGVPMVIGSTGFTSQAREVVAACARSIPVVLAPNTSVGVNVVIQVASELARVLGEGFDVEVLEAHHRMKKDAPSGTALRLAEVLASALGRTKEDFVLAREGAVGARTQKEIGVQALRGGDVVGEHTVYFFGEGERVELTHRATSRDQFAKGALRAAGWVVAQRPGLYDMADVLGFKRT